MISFMVLMEFILGMYYSLKQQKDINSSKKIEKINKNNTKFPNKEVLKNNEIKTENTLKNRDSDGKVILLMFFSGYFEFFGFLSRRLITIFDPNNDDYDEFNAKFRSIETIASSALCYFLIKSQIYYRHHICSLIFIGFCLTGIFILQLIEEWNDKESYLIKFGEVVGTSVYRAFLDTIEKYLLEYNYIDIFKLIRFQSFINLFFIGSFYICYKPRKEVKDLVNEEMGTSLLVFALLLCYAILSGFKNIYRRFTVKEYSPMSRALAESILDPIFIIIGLIEDIKHEKTNFSTLEKILYYGLAALFSVIIFICSCIYNEVFILYCRRLQSDTYLEIANRADEEEKIIYDSMKNPEMREL
jgi:hypothetical protein